MRCPHVTQEFLRMMYEDQWEWREKSFNWENVSWDYREWGAGGDHIFSEYYILLEKLLNWGRLIEEEPQTVFIIASWVEAHMDFQSSVNIFI